MPPITATTTLNSLKTSSEQLLPLPSSSFPDSNSQAPSPQNQLFWSHSAQPRLPSLLLPFPTVTCSGVPYHAIPTCVIPAMGMTWEWLFGNNSWRCRNKNREVVAHLGEKVKDKKVEDDPALFQEAGEGSIHLDLSSQSC